MSIIRCERGHYYDNKKFRECPHCGGKVPSFGEELPDQEIGGALQSGEEEGKSIGLFESTIDRSPVVGWLVCTNGPEKGRDYRLRAGRNFIGRSWKMDVCIMQDQLIEQENHASVVYDSSTALFSLVTGESTLIFHNGNKIEEVVVLNDGDSVGFGKSVFDFVAYCKKGRQWTT